MRSATAVSLTHLEVIYEDSSLIAVHKPCGTLSHPNPGEQKAAAFEGPYDLAARCFSAGSHKVWLLHRLDKDTSGALLGAKSEAAARAIRSQFDERTIRKEYVALVSSIPLKKEGSWRDHIVVMKGRGGALSKVVRSQPPNAELQYRVRATYRQMGLALLDLVLVTGKTHQIRVQCAHRRCPILGDRLYGNPNTNKRWRGALNLKRLFLHAAALELQHPDTGKRLRIECPLPEELLAVLGRAR